LNAISPPTRRLATGSLQSARESFISFTTERPNSARQRLSRRVGLCPQFLFARKEFWETYRFSSFGARRDATLTCLPRRILLYLSNEDVPEKRDTSPVFGGPHARVSTAFPSERGISPRVALRPFLIGNAISPFPRRIAGWLFPSTKSRSGWNSNPCFSSRPRLANHRFGLRLQRFFLPHPGCRLGIVYGSLPRDLVPGRIPSGAALVRTHTTAPPVAVLEGQSAEVTASDVALKFSMLCEPRNVTSAQPQYWKLSRNKIDPSAKRKSARSSLALRSGAVLRSRQGHSLRIDSSEFLSLSEYAKLRSLAL